MGETVNLKEIPALTGTVNKIQKRIKTLVEGSNFAFFDEDQPPEARFQIIDSKTKKSKIISTVFDIGPLVSVEIPDVGKGTEAFVEHDHEQSSTFKKLSIWYNESYPQVQSVIKGYYDSEKNMEIISEENSLTEADAQEFLQLLNFAGPDNEVDSYDQTQLGRERNKQKADELRQAADFALAEARVANMISVYGREGGYTTEQARYKRDGTKTLIHKGRESGIYVIDIQGDGAEAIINQISENPYVSNQPHENGIDDEEARVRPRIHIIIPSAEHEDQRIHVRLVADPVKDGEIGLDLREIDFDKEPPENIAKPYDIDDFLLRVRSLRREDLVPPRKDDPGELQDA